MPKLWERHLLNCAVVCPLVDDHARVVDVGSGAGLPGIVWAIARPDLSVTLVESLLRRTTWLGEVVDDLGLPVRVLRGRAEEVRRRAPELLGADVVTARAVAPLATLAGWTVPLMGPDGQVLALKGATAGDEIARDRDRLAKLKVAAELIECRVPLSEAASRNELGERLGDDEVSRVVRLRRVRRT